MTKFFHTVLLLLCVSAMPAYAGQNTPPCDGAACKAWQSGIGARPGKPTKCLITISAPTYGGKIALDVRRGDRASRWGKPRIKHVGPGVVTFRIGCSWLEEPTNEVYLCTEGGEGEFSSVRLRETGSIDKALRTRRLNMCLKGEACSTKVTVAP